MDALAACVTDVDNIDERKLVAAAEYIEKYENISCTIKEGYETGSYRVYAYHEDKLYDIDTKIPSLTALYIKMQPDGRFMLHFGTLSGKEQKKIEKLDASKDVKALQDSVNKKLEELQSTNQEVRDFCNMLNESSGDGPESTANIDGEAGSANGRNPGANRTGGDAGSGGDTGSDGNTSTGGNTGSGSDAGCTVNEEV